MGRSSIGRIAAPSPNRSSPATSISLLDGRASNGSVRTVNTAIPRQWLQNGFASGALVEPLTRIDWHRFDDRVAAFGTRDFAFQDYILTVHGVVSVQ